MLRLIPAPAHRAALRAAHALRKLWWQVRRPRLEAVSVVASDIEGRLLLIRLSYGTETWSFPAGGVGRGEEPVDAARRELAEETGCVAHGLTLLGVQEDMLRGATIRVHVFSAKVSDHPVPDDREVIEARFFPTHSLPEPLSMATRRRLDLWRAKRGG
jgi:ADP-ribose pyrophosphatase YjhB (NUDIX family)